MKWVYTEKIRFHRLDYCNWSLWERNFFAKTHIVLNAKRKRGENGGENQANL